MSAYDPDKNGGILLSRPGSSIPNTENSQIVKLQLDNGVTKVISEDGGRSNAAMACHFFRKQG